MDSITALRRTVAVVDDLLAKTTDEQLAAPTPCEGWAVRDLLNHITGGAEMFAISAEQGSISDADLGRLMGGDVLGDDWRGAWSTASKRAVAAFGDPALLEKDVTLPFGTMPAGAALDIAVFDVATHAADLAQATGQTIADDELLENALEMGRRIVPQEWRGTPSFAHEVPCADDAPAAQRLLAFAGRSIA